MAGASSRPHAVMIPYPAQGHITPMLQIAKNLHHRGFHITYVNTEYNHKRLLKSQPSLGSIDDFVFEAIPDGLPPSDEHDVTQDIPQLCKSTRDTCAGPLRDLLMKIQSSRDAPSVTCIVCDGFMTFTLEVAKEMGDIPVVLFQSMSGCGFFAYLHYQELIQRDYTPAPDESCLTNGYLETAIDWIPGMKGIRLRDFPSFIRTTDKDDLMLNFASSQVQNAHKAHALIINTYDDLEHDVIAALKAMFPRFYTIGPLPTFVRHLPDGPSKSMGGNLWREDPSCLEWLDAQEPCSVVYVNFGSITVMSTGQLEEFAWGLANTGLPFLWVVRPDLITGENATKLSLDFIEETKGRGRLVSWCNQEEVLLHPSIGVFLTHNGWNSTLESICSGVPMICWPFFAEQTTNCWYVCSQWGIGIEIDNNVRRGEVERLIRQVMEGEEGKEIRGRVKHWKQKSEGAAKPRGTSYQNWDKFVNDFLLSK